MALALFVTVVTAIASANSAVQPDTTYLALPYKANDNERIRGQYIIAFHNDYDPADHQAYIQEHLKMDPATDDNWEWIDIAKSYVVTGLPEATLELIRRDRNVEGVVEDQFWTPIREAESRIEGDQPSADELEALLEEIFRSLNEP